MSDDIIFFILLLIIPAGLVLVFGGVQWALANWLNGKILRMALLGLLPGASGIGMLYFLFWLLTDCGWDLLAWALYLYWCGAALVGAVAGWVIGCNHRKKRKGEPHWQIVLPKSGPM